MPQDTINCHWLQFQVSVCMYSAMKNERKLPFALSFIIISIISISHTLYQWWIQCWKIQIFGIIQQKCIWQAVVMLLIVTKLWESWLCSNGNLSIQYFSHPVCDTGQGHHEIYMSWINGQVLSKMKSNLPSEEYRLHLSIDLLTRSDTHQWFLQPYIDLN